ncbi:unnamed protein product, partial [Brassica rapa subsp. narinosa]
MGLYPSDQDLYGCTECKTVICVECAIGKYPYLKPGITINVRVLRLRLHPIAVFLGRYVLHVTTSAETNWFQTWNTNALILSIYHLPFFALLALIVSHCYYNCNNFSPGRVL